MATSRSYSHRGNVENASNKGKDQKKILTSSRRSTSGLFFKNWLMFPLFIHSDTITNRWLVIVTPSRGNTFGWRRVLHIMTSLQNLCMGHYQPGDGHKRCRRTHSSDSIKIIRFTLSQTLGCNHLAEVLALPHVRKSTTSVWSFRWFVTKRNLQGFRKQGLTATNPVRSAQTPHTDLLRETVQYT